MPSQAPREAASSSQALNSGIREAMPSTARQRLNNLPPPPNPNEGNWDAVSEASTERLEEVEVGIQEEGEGRLVIPLALNLDKVMAPEVYREMIARAQNVSTQEGASTARNAAQDVTISFLDLQLNGLEEKERNVVEGTLKENLSSLKSYLVGKKKGEDKRKSAFTLIPGQTDESRARYYFLKVDKSLLEKLFRTLKDASISASLKIKPGSPTDAQSTSTSSQRAHPYLNAVSGPEVEKRFETDGVSGTRVADLLSLTTPGMVRLRAVDVLFTPASALARREMVKERKKVSKDENVHFTLTINIDCANGAKLREKVKLGSDQILQAVYNLDDASKDVTIVAGNGTEIKCHTSILMAQSVSFHSMMSAQGRIELNENSKEGLREFIRFLYGFEVPLEGITCDLALELFHLGNKFKVSKLKDALKYFLCEKKMDFFTVDKILEMYFTAKDVHCLGELRAHALMEMSRLSEETLKSSNYFRRLPQEDQVDLLFKLLEWNK